jgi:hypothetical protein
MSQPQFHIINARQYAYMPFTPCSKRPERIYGLLEERPIWAQSEDGHCMECNLVACVQSFMLFYSGARTYCITIFAPMIYTASCIMFKMRAYPLRGQVGGGWALEFESFLGPVKWHRANRRVPFGAQKTQDFQGLTPSHLPK